MICPQCRQQTRVLYNYRGPRHSKLCQLCYLQKRDRREQERQRTLRARRREVPEAFR